MAAARWWITLTAPGGVHTAGGQLTAHFIHSATAPAKKGDVWGVYGPWPTRAAAEQAWNDRSYQDKPVSTAGDSPVRTGQGPLGLSGIGDLIARIGQPVFWLRAAEVIIGAVLLIVGIGKMTGAGSTVLQVARNAPKVIPI